MKRVRALLFLLMLCTVGDEDVAAQGVTPVSLDSVRTLGLDSINGPATAYFRSADQARGTHLQSLLTEFLDFYREQIGVEARMRVAVLSVEDWALLTSIPYGLPNNSGPGAGNLLLAASLPPERIGARVMPRGLAGDVLVIGHEGGHLMTWELMPQELKEALTSAETPLPDMMLRLQNIGSVPVWYWELAANYLTTAFLEARRPDEAAAWHHFLQKSTEIATPKFTHLGDWFSSLQQAVGPESMPYVFSEEGGLNQGWYQGVVGLVAAHIYYAAGLTFVDHIRTIVAGNEAPNTHELVQQLNAIAPGVTHLLTTLGAKWSTSG